ncbi:hypothetical protein BOTBODRAFT_404385 [Botryobasidium botryosum FD-172 SS1]|uniref:Uncharacterized protein n=1 Tax=Botryobasidium botryosum (strain FD-172 SS1) TaxID=930990 RepID=A0A067MAW7_BOTB1|nr:hypothetical protein BOTBODRAFT_404385 [Botryobasidium botryosum FD-172 SS1]
MRMQDISLRDTDSRIHMLFCGCRLSAPNHHLYTMPQMPDAVCSECSKIFPRMEGDPCQKCIKKSKASSQAEIDTIDEMNQCTVCGLVYRYMKPGACAACTSPSAPSDTPAVSETAASSSVLNSIWRLRPRLDSSLEPPKKKQQPHGSQEP